MDDQPGALRARSVLAAYAAGDLKGVVEHFTEDVVFHVPGRHHLAGDYTGRDALLGYLETVRALTGGNLTMELDRVLAGERYTAVFSRLRGTLGQRSVDVLMAQTFVNGADGRFSEYYALADDQQAYDAFWGAG
jgi:ketosteroid isomerase-like protein